jgi:hypothetical protein
VFAVDANSYFACPGPRLFDGLELMAHLIHPDLFDWTGDPGAMSPLRTKACGRCQAPFLCRPAPGCWCEGVDLSCAAAETLKGLYRDCLCPDCLDLAARPQTAWAIPPGRASDQEIR